MTNLNKRSIKASEIRGASVVSEGRHFVMVSNSGSIDLYEIIGEEARLRGGGISEDAVRRMIDEIASGRSAERFEAFQASLDTRVDAVSKVVSDALAHAGYLPSHTGGGCMAWSRDGEANTHILISSDLDLDGDPNAPEWTVGRYGKEDGSVVVDCVTLADALRLASELPEAETDLYFESEADLMRHRDAAVASPN